MINVKSNGLKSQDLEHVRAALFSSSSSLRLRELDALNVELTQGVTDTQLPDVLQLLFDTYPFYNDRPSRQAVQRCLRTIFSLPAHNDLSVFIQALIEESGKPGIAPTNAFVLVEWCSLVLVQISARKELWEQWGLNVMLAEAQVLELCQGSGVRDSVKTSALVVTRRGLRRLVTKEAVGEDAVRTVVARLTAKAAAPTAKNAVFLGVVAGVCSRIPKGKEIVCSLKKDYYDFYVREVIGSKIVVPRHIANGLYDFFIAFTTKQELQNQIIPPVEKALLRAPEVVLNDLISPLILSLPTGIDLSDILQGNLLKPLLANIKSTNAAIRHGSLSTFETITLRCYNENNLETVADEILNPLKTSKISVVDQRVFHAQMLSAIPSSAALARKIPLGLQAVTIKEPNEAAVGAQTAAIAKHMAFGLSSGIEVDKSVTETFKNGLGDKRAPMRRIWAIRIGDLLWNLDTSKLKGADTVFFVETMITKLLDAWKEVVASPLPTAQVGSVTAAYIFTSLALSKLMDVCSQKFQVLLKQSNIRGQGLTFEPKPSFLLSHRIYTKLSAEEDLIWAVRALAAVSNGLSKDDVMSAIGDAWAQGFLYLISASSIPPEVRREATLLLSAAYIQQPAHIAKVLLNGLWQWRRRIEHGEKDTAAMAAKSGTSRLFLAVRSISLPLNEAEKLGGKVNSDVLANQLIEMLVLCRSELLPHVDWIEICLRAGADPGALAQAHPTKCLGQVCAITQSRRQDTMSPTAAVKKAAYNAAAELAFVAPGTITPMLVTQIEADLNTKELDNIGPTEAAIFRTPASTPFVDVLAKKGQNQVPDKNVKDYDTLKWEAELRSQLAQKKGQQRKLTADEQAKVNAQLAKENSIREAVGALETKLQRGVGIISSLATGPPTEAEIWIGPAIKALLNIVSAGAGMIIGDAATTAYLACAERVSSRLGILKTFVGVATLRALAVSQLPKELEEEPLGDLITRILYRLRFTGEQRPFDTVSLTYILPLVFAVLRQGGMGTDSGEEADEQVVLALEFLSYHSNSCSDSRLPRAEMLSVLISSMQKFNQHYKTIKNCLHDLCRSLAANISEHEINILVQGVIVPQISVRTCVLQAINTEIDLIDLDFSDEIWLACHDDVNENVETARMIWEENGLEIEEKAAYKILPYLESTDKQLRRSAARALSDLVSSFPSTLGDILSRLQELYRERARPRIPERDEYGMPRKVDLTDPWEARNGFALAFKELAMGFQEPYLTSFLLFLINEGPLGDPDTRVRGEMLDAATTIIGAHGQDKVEELMKTFELTLQAPDQSSETFDRVNEAVIILYGALARHLDAGDGRVSEVVGRLLATLSTPSETVQYAVAECLPPLIRSSSQNTPDYVQRMLDQLFQSKKYAARRGAAYGLAGIVKGKGISALRDFRIMSGLKGAIDNKKDANYRQGALFAYELLSLILGRIFEPYIIQIVPNLLSSFGDGNTDVREACLDTAKTCFASLSSFGVKQILPTLLEGLDEQQWRSKKGACDLLGAMAYLDPQQLAMSLPDIIPPLTNVLNDSHKEVRASANRSLQRFGEVISNPEVKGLVSILLKALSDPTKYTDEALDALIKVSFVHYLDSPSLALVVRILERGLGERSATKRKGAQIIGSLAHLTERKDLVSHLPILVAGLKLAIVDPVPTTRATASKALGSLIEKLGEDALPDLIPGLMSTLKSDTGAGDRLGSAQALSEVLAGLGTSRLEETLPTILQNVSSSKPSVREGFMSLFIYLPACFGNSFTAYLSKIIPPILSGLADEVESIRETSLRAGRLLVKNFSTRAIDLLLPELERGLADDSYRIRLSSVELVGDLLFNLTGISAKTEQDEVEDNANEAGQSLLEVLGEEKRNKVLSSLYICRCDTSGLVRSAAINIWKALVASPRTLKELIPTLTQLIIRRLASTNMEQKVIAGNALGELIRKAGEGVLSSLLPTLEEGLLTSTDTDAKQGICIALRELISSASIEALEDYEKTLISVVRTALVDPEEEVREAAAEAFDSLQRIFGKKAVDQVLPSLLNLLRNEEEADNALSALLTLLTDNTRSNIILPNLIPTLLTPPITSFNARALASLSEVASSAMTRRLPTVLNSLMENIVKCKDKDLQVDLSNSFNTVLLSVDEYDGLNTAMSVILALVKHDDHRKRAAADLHLAKFFAEADIDYSRFNQDLIRALLISFDDRDSDVVKAAWAALNELIKKLRKEEMESLVFSTRQTLQHVGVAGSNLPGFALPRGINAILPIFLQGLMNGTAEQRTQSALAISDIIDRTSGDSLKPFVTQITGPLIRVVSERSVDVKSAILLTLNNLLEKIPTFLKPFLPQLQRTFAKSLADTSSDILRTRAAKALGTLITLTPRIDPLIAELVTGSRTTDFGVRNAMLKALFEVVSKAGANMSEASRTSILGLIDHDIGDVDDSMAITNARLLGALMKNLPPDGSIWLIKNRVLSTSFSKASVLGLNSVLLESPQSLIEYFPGETISIICQGISSQKTFISDNCVLAAGKYLLIETSNKEFEAIKPLFEALATAIQPGNPVDTRRLALVVIRTVGRLHSDLTRPHLALLTPPVFASVRDPVIPVKLSAEAAFLTLFSVVQSEGTVFEDYMAGAGAKLPPNTKRSMQDYFKRIAIRLGSQARERKEAEGGQGGLGLSGDERDDEREVWSVGKVDLGEGHFGDE
ncbi:MAG: translational activator of GCN4 [Pycnora praestabilis]|nr:MAG: translational activator of GCN4 [Pycnora praestabilis]